MFLWLVFRVGSANYIPPRLLEDFSGWGPKSNFLAGFIQPLLDKGPDFSELALLGRSENASAVIKVLMMLSIKLSKKWRKKG